MPAFPRGDISRRDWDEITRIGMKENDFDTISDLIIKILNSNSPSFYKNKVYKFRAQFQMIQLGYGL